VEIQCQGLHLWCHRRSRCRINSGSFFPEAPLYVTFPLISGISLVSSVVTCLISAPVDKSVLDEFYRLVRPKGLWRRFKKAFPDDGRDTSSGRDITNIIIGIVWVTALYLTPVYLVFKDLVSGILAFVCCICSLDCSLLHMV